MNGKELSQAGLEEAVRCQAIKRRNKGDPRDRGRTPAEAGQGKPSTSCWGGGGGANRGVR